jgi:hypothetical protein
MRTTVMSSVPGVRPNRAEPHCTQNTFSRPPSGAQPRRCSAPESRVTDSGATRADGAAAVPLRRWQRVQWQ